MLKFKQYAWLLKQFQPQPIARIEKSVLQSIDKQFHDPPATRVVKCDSKNGTFDSLCACTMIQRFDRKRKKALFIYINLFDTFLFFSFVTRVVHFTLMNGNFEKLCP